MEQSGIILKLDFTAQCSTVFIDLSASKAIVSNEDHLHKYYLN